MMTNKNHPSYTSQYSNTSMESDESELAPPSKAANIVYYGPIQIRLCRKPAPTIATGRRSKHLVLSGDEAVKREKRREKNRDAAKKLKEKRQIIEDELSQQVQLLENEHSDLQNGLEQLRQQKQKLEEQINDLLNDPLEELLLNNNQNMPLYCEQYPEELEFFEESISHILNHDLNTRESFLSSN